MSGNRVYSLDLPAQATCLVADSPHSGRAYPPDFNYACRLSELRKAEDARLDELYDFLPGLGITFLKAAFPRSYIDLNRPDDVTAVFWADPGGFYAPSRVGLVRGVCTLRSTEKIYDRPLPLKEVFARHSAYFRPYNEKLEEVLADTAALHGKAVHLDLHSMPSTLSGPGDVNVHDVIVGTRGGTCAAPALGDQLARLFAQKGYKTVQNAAGFEGGEIIARTARPADGRHSLQIELNRALYVDEESLEFLPRYDETKNDLKEIVMEFAGFCARF